MNRRILSLLLAALLAVGLLPVGAFAAEGDAAPTAALPDGASLTVTDTGMTDVDGISQVYKTTVPKETASIMVNWDGLDTAKAYSCCTCYDDGKYEHTGVGPLTVPLAGHSNDETTAVEDKYISSEVLAKVKSNSQDKMVILLMYNGANTKGAVLCIEVGSGESGETTDPDNTPPTLCEGVNATGDRKTAYEGIPFTLDLSTIFTDADGDDLTYTVSIDGGEAESTDAVFTRTFEKWATLKFSANDGKVDSDKTYTVTVNYYQKAVQLKESGSGEAAAGESVHIYMSDAFKDPSGTGRTFYVSIGGGEKEQIGSGQTNRVKFSRAFATPGVYTLAFYVGHGPEFVGPYTYTLTVTGETVVNHTPYLLDTADSQKRTEPMWTAGGQNLTNWRPDLTQVFGDEDGYNTLSFTFHDDRTTQFTKFYTGSTQPGYAVGGSDACVGERTVTIRATDPYGAYVDYVCNITVYKDHRAVRKAGVKEAYTFEVPFGATLALNADDYFEDTDSKDIGNVMFNTSGKKTYSYTAKDPASDLKVKMYGYSGSDRSIDSIDFTFRTVLPESWPTLTSLTASTLYGTASADTSVKESEVNVKKVTITQYDALRVSGGKAAAGVISIRVDEDATALGRSSYELYGGYAEAAASTGAAVGAELDDDIALSAANDYYAEKAVSVNLPVNSEQYGDYTLTVYYDLKVVGLNARPVLAVAESTKREKITLGATWTLNLDGLFSDEDGDTLSYKVAVNGAAATAIDGSTYSYTPEDGVHTLVFTASDGKAESKDTYTVTLLTRNPGAPEWPQILAYSLESVSTYADKSLTVPVTKTELVQYDSLVTDGKKQMAGEIVIYVAEDFTSLDRNWYGVAKDAAKFQISNGATSTVNKAVTVRKSSDWKDNSAYKVSDNGQDVYYYIKMAVAETPFTPGIGNGYADGTTENGVTTFLAGTGSAAPTVTVTAPADGWTAGGNTFTVACEKACVVMVKSGETYTKLVAADSGDTHSFTATLADGDQIIVRLKGDVNGDGQITTADFGQTKAAALGNLALNELNINCATVSGGESVRTADFGQIKAAALGNLTFNW